MVVLSVNTKEIKTKACVNILPVIHPTVALGQLGAEIGELAGEQKIIFGRNSERVTHERRGVYSKCASHCAGDTVIIDWS